MSDRVSPNDETRAAWDANAELWDSKMGDEGNDFFRILQWPVITEFLEVLRWPQTSAQPHNIDLFSCFLRAGLPPPLNHTFSILLAATG
jgi:hypothetical protein